MIICITSIYHLLNYFNIVSCSSVLGDIYSPQYLQKELLVPC